MSDRAKSDTDLQDPLPESNWLWRRVFTFVAVLVIFALLIWLGAVADRIVSAVVGKIDTMSSDAVAQITVRALAVVEQMFRLMFYALLVVVTYYMVAPSAEQITKMLQTARLLKAGVQVAARTVESPGRREEAKTVGRPPQPETPEVPSDKSPRAGDNRGRIDDVSRSGRVAAETPEKAILEAPDDMPDIQA